MKISDDYRKYLQPEVVAKLSNMELVARLVVEGFITGLHKSPYHGFSVEFAEHRQYMPGDEPKHIDWKIYGKTDRYYIKQFEEETNLKSYIILDASRSMAYGSNRKISKLEYASYIAAALSYLMVQQRDAVGLTVYDEKVRTFMPPHATKSYLKAILKQLELTEGSNKTGTAASLHQIADRIKRRGLVIILSDLFDKPNEVATALKHFRHKKNEVIVMQVLDPLERSFAFGGDAVFKDMETSEEIMTQPWHLQKAYQEEMKKFLDYYKKECRENNIDYVLLDTTTPFDTALFQYLSKRQRLG
ncbi:MAG: DUF58 domain-containing protein [Bacteroidetes bacterium]|nr:DUF58 domain-containing protein [Bacteroidota bacterium]MBU1423542.1 DUF58 domain-containing protein [Bacteroidota bacterium]MBU2471645.1 DUF58 domain-containing protein [Bacteroidota bacterium]MBU2636128.1 DUF58 domain-containing protein [Bacteroidota bacterium]